MFKVMALAETYMLAGIATKNLMGTANPLAAFLGDLNPNAPSGSLMGPQGPGVLTLKEIVTGVADTRTTAAQSGGLRPAAGVTTYSATGGNPYEQLASNFSSNWINIVFETALTTAGFRIANKVLSKPKAKINAMLRQSGLGTTVQI